jgi:hypothetical protein
MECRELNQMLITEFPNLKNNYIEETSWQEGDETGSHTVFGDVFTPYVVEIIDKCNEKELKNIFRFIEDILLLKDEYAEEVIALSVIESIEVKIKNNKKIIEMLGEKTKYIFNQF